jgi:hypothetical protein
VRASQPFLNVLRELVKPSFQRLNSELKSEVVSLFLWSEIKNENLQNTTGLIPDRPRDAFPIALAQAEATTK